MRGGRRAARVTSPRRALLLATGAYVVGQSAHTTFMYYLVPLALRAGGILGKDAYFFAGTAVAMGALVVPAGRLADRVPRRRVLRAGLILLGLAYAALLPAPSVLAIMAGTALTGAGLALLFVSFTSYVADLLASSERGAAYGRTSALSILAGASGPFLAALVVGQVGDGLPGIRACALLFGAMTLAAVALTWGLPSARAKPRVGPRVRPDRRAILPIMALYLLMGVGYGMTLPYFAVYFLDHARFTAVSWGYLLAFGTAVSAAGSFVAGRLAARVRPALIAVGGQVGLLGASLLFVLPLPAAAQAGAYLARSSFAATTSPVVSTVLMERVAEDVRAESTGYSSLAWNVGWVVGASAGSVFLASVSGAVFPLGALLAVAGVVVGVRLLRPAGS